MTIGLAIWLIFKTLALSLAALAFAALAICALVGGVLAAHEDVRPRWMPSCVLAIGLLSTMVCIAMMNRLAQVILA
ncbi:hypothetical protein MOK15_00680 [Sphingobium sp. BYY-5]|uniref:hypothetical protein n=1 Tax=Sphingobium sp. BYY-5 TaxID=2926400 RepID=UPI001FA6F107|nr:hypothetical protein [Sphingobium sp. BYY-5]MCI4588624.1 hypothetical protein [Sphingobium sp. BYY-5]